MADGLERGILQAGQAIGQAITGAAQARFALNQQQYSRMIDKMKLLGSIMGNKNMPDPVRNQAQLGFFAIGKKMKLLPENTPALDFSNPIEQQTGNAMGEVFQKWLKGDISQKDTFQTLAASYAITAQTAKTQAERERGEQQFFKAMEQVPGATRADVAERESGIKYGPGGLEERKVRAVETTAGIRQVAEERRRLTEQRQLIEDLEKGVPTHPLVRFIESISGGKKVKAQELREQLLQELRGGPPEREPKAPITATDQLKRLKLPNTKNNQIAIEELIKANAPITKANIEAAKQQLGLK